MAIVEKNPPSLLLVKNETVAAAVVRFVNLYNREDYVRRRAKESVYMAATGHETARRSLQTAMRDMSSIQRDLAAEERSAAGDERVRLDLYELDTGPKDFERALRVTVTATDAFVDLKSTTIEAPESTVIGAFVEVSGGSVGFEAESSSSFSFDENDSYSSSADEDGERFEYDYGVERYENDAWYDESIAEPTHDRRFDGEDPLD